MNKVDMCGDSVSDVTSQTFSTFTEAEPVWLRPEGDPIGCKEEKGEEKSTSVPHKLIEEPCKACTY